MDPITVAVFGVLFMFLLILLQVPIGIAMARSDAVEAVVRPILDFMQTMPPFVYLIPAAIFFGLGKVPGAIATLIFAMPPAVRLTNLGIRQVSREHVEAGQAFGCTGRQLLFNTNEGPGSLETSSVVIAAGVAPEDTLYQQAKDRLIAVHKIGDCLEPRSIKEAIYEGAVAGRSV